MAIGGITGAWTPNAPSDSSNAGLGAGDIRSLKTQVQEPLDSEHNFPSAGGAAMGAHRLGSARVYVGTASQVSSADTDGRLMVTSDTSRLYTLNSSTTMLLGGRYAVLGPNAYNNKGSQLTSFITQAWMCEAGRGTLVAGSATTAITLNNAYLANAVCAVVVPASTAQAVGAQYVADVSSTLMTISRVSDDAITAGGSNEDVTYFVIGRVTLA